MERILRLIHHLLSIYLKIQLFKIFTNNSNNIQPIKNTKYLMRFLIKESIHKINKLLRDSQVYIKIIKVEIQTLLL